MRLNKLLAIRANCSRRKAEEHIFAGLVRVNKKLIKDPAFSTEEEDIISLRGKILKPKEGYTVIIYNKPKGELVTSFDDRGRRTIYDTLGAKFKGFVSVGRLDWASEGLLLLTDDKTIAHKLSNSALPREYNIKFKGLVTFAMEEAMQKGLFLKDATKGAHKNTKIQSMQFKPFLAYKTLNISSSYTRMRVVLQEGKNRELRRFFAHFDRDLLDLKRVRFGDFYLNNLPSQKFRYLSSDEYELLREFLKENN